MSFLWQKHLLHIFFYNIILWIILSKSVLNYGEAKLERNNLTLFLYLSHVFSALWFIRVIALKYSLVNLCQFILWKMGVEEQRSISQSKRPPVGSEVQKSVDMSINSM